MQTFYCELEIYLFNSNALLAMISGIRQTIVRDSGVLSLVLVCLCLPHQPVASCDCAQETDSMLAELAYKASLVESSFNQLEGFRCNVVQGAMYAFPQIRLPERFIQQAKVSVGVCIVQSDVISLRALRVFDYT